MSLTPDPMIDVHARDNRTGSATRASILAEATRWLGTPYCHQASACQTGTDCLGLIVGVWNAVSGQPLHLARTDQRSWAQHAHGEPLLDGLAAHLDRIDWDKAQPGDVLALRWRRGWPASHVALLMPGQTIIHAYEGGKVVRSHLAPWVTHRAGAFRFPAFEKTGA